jgi:hypothetical protein
MQLNATCLIQIGNFWLTYLILHKLLLHPFVKAIEKKKHTQALLAERLKEKERLIHTLQDSKVRNLEEFRHYIKQNYIAPTIQPQAEPETAGKIATLNHTEIEKIAQKIEAAVIAKAPHVV